MARETHHDTRCKILEKFMVFFSDAIQNAKNRENKKEPFIKWPWASPLTPHPLCSLACCHSASNGFWHVSIKLSQKPNYSTDWAIFKPEFRNILIANWISGSMRECAVCSELSKVETEDILLLRWCSWHTIAGGGYGRTLALLSLVTYAEEIYIRSIIY
jgi:hypothetical protein